MSKFYITTPIYYVNSDLHLGHAYTTVLADVFARYNKLMGRERFMLTGVDEHGQKVMEAALEEQVDPQAHCDRMSIRFKDLWRKLGVKYSHYIRTTDPEHVEVVSAALQKLHDKGELYATDYEGHYCVPCERYFMKKDLEEGNCPLCKRPVELLKERNWFFRMSKYQDWLIRYIHDHPAFIQPENRRNEVLGFLKQPLRDLCISRLKERMSWGIELPFDRDYVCYVWVDALLNYLSGIGKDRDEENFTRWWPADVHLIGKDILTTHCVYWPTLLKALDIEPPRTFLIHGWWLVEDQKMSKSLGNVIRPLEMIDKVGVDGFRFFLIREMVPWNDASFSPASLVHRINVDLANDLGNMLSRVSNLAAKFFDGRLPAAKGDTDELRGRAENLLSRWRGHVEGLNLFGLLEDLFGLLRYSNQVVENRAPWKLVKTDRDAAGRVLADLAEALRLVSLLLEPVMPERCGEILERLGAESSLDPEALRWNPAGCGEIRHGEPVFPRIDEERFLADLEGGAQPAEEAAAASGKGKAADGSAIPAEEQGVGLVSFADFSRIKLVAARILEAERVAGADRLLRLLVDAGDAPSETPRQIVAGIAQHYTPQELLDRMICLVANLEPAKIRGIESRGMLLATRTKGRIVLVDPGDVPPGTSIS